MKQKNLILMVVAVGCGLLAAFLTSQMSAKPAAAPQHIDVLVVAKELAPGTKFTADSIKDQFKKKQIDPNAVPEKAVITEDMLDGKTLNKTLRADDFVRESDLGNYTPLLPPEGKHIVTVRLAVDKMTPFLQPNSRIDIIAIGNTKDGKAKSTILIPNMLVMAVDARVIVPNGGPGGDLQIQLASLAASRDEAQAIRICESCNVKLSFLLRSDQGNTGSGESKSEEWKLSNVVTWINDENPDAKSSREDKDKVAEGPPLPTEPAQATVKMTVPTTDLPAGTELTNDVIQAKFKEVPVIGAPPPSAVLNIKEHVGRFLVKDIAAEQFVPKNYLADKLPEKDVAKGTPDVKPSPVAPKPDQPETKPVKSLPTFDRTVVGPNGVRVMRFEIQENGELKYIGDVTGGERAPEPKPDEGEKKVQ